LDVEGIALGVVLDELALPVEDGEAPPRRLGPFNGDGIVA
jgi:hypothetical protein